MLVAALGTDQLRGMASRRQCGKCSRSMLAGRTAACSNGLLLLPLLLEADNSCGVNDRHTGMFASLQRAAVMTLCSRLHLYAAVLCAASALWQSPGHRVCVGGYCCSLRQQSLIGSMQCVTSEHRHGCVMHMFFCSHCCSRCLDWQVASGLFNHVVDPTLQLCWAPAHSTTWLKALAVAQRSMHAQLCYCFCSRDRFVPGCMAWVDI